LYPTLIATDSGLDCVCSYECLNFQGYTHTHTHTNTPVTDNKLKHKDKHG